jgi:hypothetical protein
MWGSIPKLLLVRAIMELVGNTVEGVKFIFPQWCDLSLLWYGIKSVTNKRDKERLRQLLLREEEQDRIIRMINGLKK